MSKAVNFTIKEIKTLLNMIGREYKETKETKTIIKRLERACVRIKTSSAKSKGRELQKTTCKFISEATGFPYDQSDDQCLIHSREMGQSGVDVILRGSALEAFPFAIECKNVEQFDLPAVIRQAKKNTPEGLDWLIVHKRKSLNRPIAIMDLERFVKMFVL